MISNLFAQFRHQYANGSLTSELLMTHADQYLVKATVSIGDQVIGTALAADTALAIADDQAKTRVLAMLGYGQDSSAEIVPPAPKTISSNSEAISSADAKPPATDIAKDTVTVSTAAPSVDLDSSADTTEAGDDDMGRPLDSFTPDEAPAPAEVPASSIAATAIENFDDTHPVDLSDIIAQTDVEMTRLGWSNVQGRSYLEKTFNKRSRQQLTDEELLTFLLYLESQATPTMG